MGHPAAPASPSKTPALRTHHKILIALAVLHVIPVVLLMVLRIFGLIRPFYIPYGSMAPAVSVGDHVMMEGISYLKRKPHRGDIVVFSTEGLNIPPPTTFYTKRVAGESGESIRISAGKVYVNDSEVTLTNKHGQIMYSQPGIGIFAVNTNLMIPPGEFFVLGDNSNNSLDSRFWGCLPRENVIGRICFCYWPPSRIGFVK